MTAGTTVRRTILAGLAWSALAGAGAARLAAQATPTRVLVRVVAHDAKIIGSNVDGARVTIRDAESGEVLAEGVQEGSTGSTDLIMGAREWGATVFDTEGAAGFTASLEVARPTRVTIAGEGPLGTPHAVQTATKSLLLVPGRDVLGEGVILELNGFTVELASPAEGVELAAGERFDVRASVTMLCGCPTEPGGLWDSSAYEIVARAVRGGEVVAEWPMEFTGTTSEYAATGRLDAPGAVELQVLAMHPERANFGMATRAVRVR